MKVTYARLQQNMCTFPEFTKRVSKAIHSERKENENGRKGKEVCGKLLRLEIKKYIKMPCLLKMFRKKV